jgi:hypothetical protein
MGSSSLRLRIAAACMFAAAILLPALSVPGPVRSQDGERQEFVFDLVVADPADACQRIEDTRTVVIGEQFLVAVCLLYAPEPPAVVTFSALYDDRVILAPNIGACDGVFDEARDLFATPVPGAVASLEEALDCNPDANVGRSTFGPTNLGEGWDCTSGGIVEPWGNRESEPTGDLFNGGCISIAGPYTLAPSAAVAMISFRAERIGRTAITPNMVQITGASGVTTGTCFPTIDTPMPCSPGFVVVEGSAEPTPTDDDGNDLPWSRIGIGAAFGALFLAGLAVLFRPWRRWRRSSGEPE